MLVFKSFKDEEQVMVQMVLLKDGNFESAEPFGSVSQQMETIRNAVGNAVESNKPLVIHFHGGLVKREDGIGIAHSLDKIYGSAGGIPLFFVWQTGFLETIKTNYEDALKGRLLNWAIKRIRAKVGAKLINTKGISSVDSTPSLSEEEIQNFKSDLERDIELDVITRNLQNAANVAFGEDVPINEELFRSVIKSRSNSSVVHEYYVEASLMRPDFFVNGLDNTQHATHGPQSIEKTFGLIGSLGLKAKIIKAIVSTAIAVVRRRLNNTDHGLHATIVEELSRRIHGDRIGSAVWGMMKKDSADAFDSDNSAGQFLLNELSNAAVRPRVILIGHSAGSIFVSNLLKKAEHGLFDIIFLAPAVTYSSFYEIIKNHSQKIDNFRMFTMTDINERGDELINGKSFIYPSSLLYLISGILEVDKYGAADVDCPILGMERFFDEGYTYRLDDLPMLREVRQFLKSFQNGLVWSKTEGEAPAGMASGSLDHGDFDNDHETNLSLQHIIKNGF